MTSENVVLGSDGPEAASMQRAEAPTSSEPERGDDTSPDAHDRNTDDAPHDERGEPSGGVEEDLEGDKLRAERDEYLDTLRRIQAEFENYRKRIAREQTEATNRGIASLIERLLPILDALDLALVHTAETTSETGDEDTRAALIQIAALARSVLEREGLARIDDSGVAFDPKIHDAVSKVARDEDEDSSASLVKEVLRAGYTLEGKVIRPAMVIVKD
jgi:molecular chaperone GrpE